MTKTIFSKESVSGFGIPIDELISYLNKSKDEGHTHVNVDDCEAYHEIPYTKDELKEIEGIEVMPFEDSSSIFMGMIEHSKEKFSAKVLDDIQNLRFKK